MQDYEVKWESEQVLEEDIKRFRNQLPAFSPLDELAITRFIPPSSTKTLNVNLEVLRNQFIVKNKRWFSSQFLCYFLIRLDGRTRFFLTDDKPADDLLQSPKNILTKIFQDEDIRKDVIDMVQEAFGVYFTIDPTKLGTLRIRLSQSAPEHDEQSLSKVARDYYNEATYIKDCSDGIQAFIGIVITLLSENYRCILVDEPEAFLHPPLAKKLGYRLAGIASKRSGCLFASTHSPDFLMGCLQASPDVRVMRLEYSNGKSKGRLVDTKSLREVFNKPLMRSANVISGLFHDGVVVTESDNDRTFYSEIYHRLAEQEKGYPSVLFVNAQNKQTIKDIMGPLRSFGVPTAAMVDIDILKDGGEAWKSWLSASQVPSGLHNGLSQIRGDLDKFFTNSGINMKRLGVEGLEADDRVAADELFGLLAQYGVFVTRKGELENWLRCLNVPGKKTDWTIATLERLGSNPSDAAYVRPSAGDVWDFMRSVVEWIRNPGRKGTL